jgi:hypothetical protein
LLRSNSVALLPEQPISAQRNAGGRPLPAPLRPAPTMASRRRQPSSPAAPAPPAVSSARAALRRTSYRERREQYSVTMQGGSTQIAMNDTTFGWRRRAIRPASCGSGSGQGRRGQLRPGRLEKAGWTAQAGGAAASPWTSLLRRGCAERLTFCSWCTAGSWEPLSTAEPSCTSASPAPPLT